MTGRIPWSQYSGDDIEAVIAMMINRDHPDSVRIRPSQGDGGIDILDRGKGPEGGDIVYQVKKFSSSLSSSQKSQIRQSAKILLDPKNQDPRWGWINVTQWRLVVPVDPTPEDLDWFENDLLSEYKISSAWDGLTFIEQLSAKYGDVIDYYLRDGKNSVLEEVKKLFSFETLQGCASASEMASKVRESLQLVDHDPHYLYDFRFGHGEPNYHIPQPRYVMSKYEMDKSSSTWYAIDVIARCAESVFERPITISGTITANAGTDFSDELRKFHEYGSPIIGPQGSYSGTIDAPGEIGGKIEEASIGIYPLNPSSISPDASLRLEILDENGNSITCVDVDRTETSQGTSGLRSIICDPSGSLKIEMRFELSTSTSNMEISFQISEGSPVSQVVPVSNFVKYFHYPNSIRISNRNTPARFGHIISIPNSHEEQGERSSSFQNHIIELLEKIQEFSETVIKIPDFSSISQQYKSWESAYQLLSGNVGKQQAEDGQAFSIISNSRIDIPEKSLIVKLPLTVEIGEEKVSIGSAYAQFLNPSQISPPLDYGDNTLYQFTTSDRMVFTAIDPDLFTDQL